MCPWEVSEANTSLNLHTMASSITVEQLFLQSLMDHSNQPNKLLQMNHVMGLLLDLRLLKRKTALKLIPVVLMYMTCKLESDPRFLLTPLCRGKSSKTTRSWAWACWASHRISHLSRRDSRTQNNRSTIDYWTDRLTTFQRHDKHLLIK